MGAVGEREGIGDEDVAELGHLRGQGGVVLLLALVEACVLKHQNVAILHGGDGLLGLRSDAVGGEGDRLAENGSDRRHHRLQRVFGVRSVLGPAEMGKQDGPAALLGHFADGRGAGTDTRVVSDLAIRHGDVEVDADEDALALQINTVEGTKRAHGFRLL